MVERVSTASSDGGPSLQTPGAPSEAEMEQQVAQAEAANAGHEPPPTKKETREAAERPEWLPEKFKSPEALAKAYQELETKMRSEGAPDNSAEDGASGADSAAEGSQEGAASEAQQVVENAGLDFSALTTEYNDNGELSEATYESLEKAGIPKSAVDSYIAGQQALATQFTNQIYDIVGGQETYDAMVEWSGEGMTDQERGVFNAALESGNQEQIKLAVRGAFERYKGEVVEPDLVGGGNGPSTAPGFTNWDDAHIAMADPRYATSPDYRKMIEDKLARSPNL